MVQTFLSARKWWLAVLSLVSFLFLLPQITFAQTPTNADYIGCLAYDTPQSCAQQYPDLPPGTAKVDTSACPQLAQDPGFLNLSQAQQQAACTAQQKKLEEAGKGALDWIGGYLLNGASLVPAALSEIVVQLLSLGLWLAGVLFNFIVNETIVKAAQGALGSGSSSTLRPGIETAWKLIRDLINMSFIFILLYQSIQLILGRTSEAGKTIVKVAAVAILINFSIFITQVVVDASNIVAIGFYDAFTTVPENAAEAAAVQGSYDGGISSAYMNALGIQSVWDGISNGLKELDSGKSSTTILSVNLLISLFLIVTIFVFVAAAIMLLVRYIMIIFLVILSPVAFAGIILPGTQQYTKQWWETLTGQAIFAPIFMIMTWINLTLISSLYSNPERKGLEGLMESLVSGTVSSITTEVIGAVFNFTLIIGTAIASLIIAKQFANRGGKGFGTLTNYIGGAALGGAALVGRQTFGRGFQALSQNESLRRAAEKSAFARAGLRLTEKGATSAFELRNTGLAKSTGAFESMGAYKGGEGGYRKRLEERTERKVKFGQLVGGASRGTLEKLSTAEGNLQNAREAVRRAQRPGATAAEVDAAARQLRTAKAEVKGAEKKVGQERKESRERYAYQIERRRAGNLWLPSQAAKNAAGEMRKKLGGEDKGEQEKQEIKDIAARIEDLISTSGDLESYINTIDNDKFGKLPAKIFAKSQMIPYITDTKILDKVQSDNTISNAQKRDLRDNLQLHLAGPDITPGQKRMLESYISSPRGAFWS